MTTYWFTPRSPEVEHQHPYLVFDSQDRLHLPLTIFGKAINQRLAPKTVQTYLYAILPWFSYLESDMLYLELAARKQVDLSTIPLFLTAQGTQLTPKTYREHYWNPACAKVGIEADIHQARHWLVTRSVRDIYETSTSKGEIERRLQGLVEYMKWKSEETLAAYQHYFDEQLHTETRDTFHQRMHEEIQQYQQERKQGKRQKRAPRIHKQEQTLPPQSAAAQLNDEPDLAFLYALAGEA
jgi:hypothetical protein